MNEAGKSEVKGGAQKLTSPGVPKLMGKSP